jgi:dihydrofolate synthase/folylpolyglutamate synthase
MLAAAFQENGYTTGLYTSPHLYDFRERIKINGQFLSEDFIVEFVERLKPIIEKIEPSFFEITVAMAFEYFAEQNVDVAIIEVGLGGRLDSTNIITPELSIITNIGRDHMNMLGNSLEEIAAEKAGIIKPKVPVVIGERNTTTQNIFIEKSKEVEAPIFFASDNYLVQDFFWKNDELEMTILEKEIKETNTYTLDLPGIYQTKNICTFLQSVSVLQQSFSLDKKKIKASLSKVKSLTGFYGRWEIISHQPKIVLDAAHNAPGIDELLLQLQNETFENLHIVIGMVKDKEQDDILKRLPLNATYYFTEADIPRALPGKELKAMSDKFQLKGEVYTDVNEALKAAKEKATNEDLVLVCGSIFLIAEVKREKINTSTR